VGVGPRFLLALPLLAFIASVVAAPRPALAQAPAPAPAPAWDDAASMRLPVREIVFEGARRLSQSYLRELVRIKVGDTYPGMAAVNEEVKRLYNSGKVGGFIEAIPSLVPGGVRITFVVNELSEVKQVVYEGLSAVSERDILDSPEGPRIRAPRDERPGTTYEDYRARLDVETILRLERDKGKFFAEVDVEPVELEDGVKAIFHVREGPTVRVEDILFLGNDHIEGDTLRNYMKTQPTFFYFIRSGYFDRKALDDDLSNIQRYYWGEGYLDVQAMVEDLRFNEDRSRVTVVIRVIEGERYKVRRVEITGITKFQPEVVKQKLEIQDGSWFSGRALAKDIETIQKMYMDRGYIFNRVDFKRHILESERALDLAFAVEEGVPITLEKIRFEGNVKTRDDVVRREVSVFPGEPFSAESMDESKDRIGRRGYFKDLRIAFEPGTAPDKRDLVVRVEEADTGQLLFGGGVSSSTGLFGRIVFVQRNFDILDVPTSWDAITDGHFFVGGGQTLLIQAEPGQDRSRYTVTFVEPYLLPDYLPLPIQLRTTFSYYDSALGLTYDEQRLEAQLGLGYRITRDSLLEVAYRFTDTTIFRIDPFAPAEVVAVAGDNHVSAPSVSYTINQNKQDQNLLFYGGWGGSAEVEVAGGPFGGDWDFARVELNANWQTTLWHFPRDSKHVFSVRANAGWMSEYGDSKDVPIFERFFAGGPRSVRGFQFRSVGPQADDEPIGGKTRVVGTVEYSFPIIPGFDQTYAPEWRADFLRGVLFCDVGEVSTDLQSFDASDFRIGVGFGFRIKIPVFPAPVALDFGFPVRKLSTDDPELFSFSVGAGLP
ncbi:MAG TPA: outer membrane protein assembly factor BamA, partial [Planctomycetota bacterium]|nr:outer membrane protein assembly factor BamA [Planctomycetota bacterium]